MASTEREEQIRLLKRIRRDWPWLMVMAIPNGGKRTALEGARMREEGQLKGAPDLFFPELRLFIELKAAGGRLTPEQKDVLAKLERYGYQVAVCFGADAAHEKIKQVIDGFLSNR